MDFHSQTKGVRLCAPLAAYQAARCAGVLGLQHVPLLTSKGEEGPLYTWAWAPSTVQLLALAHQSLQNHFPQLT